MKKGLEHANEPARRSYGRMILSNIKRLSQVKSDKDIGQLSQAMFPGAHCPLFGAVMAASSLKDCLLVIVGTDECAYYARDFSLQYLPGNLSERCVSLVLNDLDVTFGSTGSAKALLQDLLQQRQPQYLILVTTCLVEIIGDDYEALAKELEQECRLPVLVIRTEHFQCRDHQQGLEKTFSALGNLMQEQRHDASVNILGTYGSFYSEELLRLLADAGLTLGMQLSQVCDLRAIQSASAARLNLVMDPAALPLAKLMRERFGINYICLKNAASPELALYNLRELCACLQVVLPASALDKYRKAKELEKEARTLVHKMPYIYGRTVFSCFEVNAYLTELGMRPLLLQTETVGEEDRQYMAKILSGADPYVCRGADLSSLQPLYGELKPCIYFGMESEERLRQWGIALVSPFSLRGVFGLDQNIAFLQSLINAAKKALLCGKEGKRCS